MLRRSSFWLLGMNFGQTKDTSPKKAWSDLFFKPQTRDERVKDHVPEVLEESLAEQRAVLAHQTTRDHLVEHGHKVLREIENKAPTPSIFPALNQILALYGPDHLISQRGLNLLVYPGTVSAYQQTQPPELIASFHDNFKNFIDNIEQNGSYVHDVKLPAIEAAKAEAQQQRLLAKAEAAKNAASTDSADQSGDAAGTDTAAAKRSASDDAADDEDIVIEVSRPDAEPADVTYFVKCISGMTMANLQIGDNRNALRCCDVALDHAIDDGRRGGLLALKAGVQIKLKDYEGAHASALAAIEASQSIQGYLQGAAALRLLKREEEAIALLTKGVEAHPGDEAVAGYLETTVVAKEKEAARLEAAASAGELIGDGKRARRRRLQLEQ